MLDSFLLQPLFDTYYFGCPESCIVPNGDTHQFLKILFTPLVIIGVTVGAIFGTLIATRRLPDLRSLRSRGKGKSVTEAILDSPEAEVVHKEREPKTIKQFEKAIRKENRKDFLSGLDEMESNPEIAFSKFLELQDNENHPLEAVRTEVKEEPEVKMGSEEQKFYVENKESLEKQAKQVTELMKSENITEEEAIDKIIKEMPTEVEVEIKDKDEEIDLDTDVFQQDLIPKVYPKYQRFWRNHFKKKEKPKYKYSLNELGSKRRDQYAKQIETTLGQWVFPMPKYDGKNQEYQMEEGLLRSELKKFALFLSMCEMMADKKKKKKVYWEMLRIN